MTLIAIGSLWCPSCIIMNNIINEIKKERKLNIINYDYDLDKSEVERYNVGKILPVFIIEDKNGIEKSRMVGEKSKKEFVKFLKNY